MRHTQFYLSLVLICVVVLWSSLGHTQENPGPTPTEQAASTDQVQPAEANPQIPFSKKAIDFGIVYAVQWAIYGVTQHETIRDHGSFRNMIEYPFSPHFDKDDFHGREAHES